MTQPDMSAARKAMIDSQLRTSGVNENFVLARMSAVPREDFVPESVRSVAYVDRAVPVGDGRYLAAPLFHGRMLAEADPRTDDRVLIVESGTSYLAELIRPLVAEVDTMSAEEAVDAGRKRKTYSLLLVDGAIEALPGGLAKRLEENGRIVTGLVTRGVTRLALGRKVAGETALQPLGEMGIPVLHHFDKPKAWSF